MEVNWELVRPHEEEPDLVTKPVAFVNDVLSLAAANLRRRRCKHSTSCCGLIGVCRKLREGLFRLLKLGLNVLQLGLKPALLPNSAHVDRLPWIWNVIRWKREMCRRKS